MPTVCPGTVGGGDTWAKEGSVSDDHFTNGVADSDMKEQG